MPYNEDIKLEEYRSLLEEHRRNRSYIFERPIIILALVAVAMQYSYQLAIGQFVLAGLIFILCFNLWFTANRLRSDARIVAYIQLVHEGELKAKWFGWESALRQYRIRMLDYARANNVETQRPNQGSPKDMPRSHRFYPAIWIFHIVLVALTLVVTLITWWPSKTILTGAGMAATLLASIAFMVYALGSLRPKRLNPSIELERQKWILVFGSTL